MADAWEEARRESLAVWEEMAAGWRRHNDYVWDNTRAVGQWMIDRLDPKPGHTILELAAGPGDTGFAAAAQIGDGTLICTDFAPEMVAVAKERARRYGIGNAQFKTMDAESIELADSSVDGVLCRWGLMLMLDPDRACAEVRRVLRDGGRFTAATWASPDRNPWVTMVGMMMMQMGRPPLGDPFGPGGMFSLAEHERVESMLAGAGFSAIETAEIEMSWPFDDLDHFWVFLTELAGAAAAVIAQMTDEEKAELRERLGEAFQPFAEGAGYRLPAVSLNFVAY